MKKKSIKIIGCPNCGCKVGVNKDNNENIPYIKIICQLCGLNWMVDK